MDVSADIIDETHKKKTSSPRSFAEDVAIHLTVVTPSDRVDAARPQIYIF